MRTVVTLCPVWNAWIQRPFELAGYHWMPNGGMDGYAELTRQLLASPEDVCTVTVTQVALEGSPPQPALLWDGGYRLDDLLLLLSVGQGRSVHWRQAAWELRDGETVVQSGTIPNYTNRTLANGEGPISPFEAEPFLAAALQKITQAGWAADTGFMPAAHWYLQSISSPVPEVRFRSAWNAVESLTRRDQEIAEASAGVEAIAEALLHFRTGHAWDFITDDFVSRWAELLRDFVARHPDGRMFPPRHAYILTRKLQLCLLLILLEMAGTRDFARRESVLRAIRR